MPPGETAMWAVLIETVEVESEGDAAPRVWFEQIGYITVPKGTTKNTVLKKLLTGQETPDDDSAGIPQIPMDAGERGSVHLIPAVELGEAVPIRARAAVLFEVVPAGGDGS